MREAIFWLSLGLILYSYLGYPLILFLLSALVQLKNISGYLFAGIDWRRTSSLEELPSVSLIISAYNEEKNIKQRLENFLALDYPQDKLEFLIGSDGSTDNTDTIVCSFAHSRVKLFSYPRSGKVSILNKLIPQAKGEIIVLSDANTFFFPEALKKLVRHFSDPKVGVVSGELKIASRSKKGQQEDAYWRYEIILKFLENRIGATLGANGGIYALRKELFSAIPDNTIIEDFVIPLKIKERGYAVIYDCEVKAYEEASGEPEVEFERRVRIGAGGFQAIGLTWRLLDPRRGSTALAYWSHKIIRWFGMFLLLICFFLNLGLWDIFLYRIIFLGQLLFYVLAVIGYLRREKSDNKQIFKIPFYFVYINLALFMGFFRFITKRQKVTWKKTSR